MTEEQKPFRRSDGCTFVPDIARHCCVLHDARYRGQLRDVDSRAEADRLFRRCILDMADADEWWWRPFWWAVAWAYWAGVRLFGGRAWKQRRAVFRKE